MQETLIITLAILLAAGILFAWFETSRRARVKARAEARSRAAHPAGRGR
jgi:hypothetical protein